MILASFYILCYILSMATYVLDYKTARIFGEVKKARVSGKPKVWSERVKTQSGTGPKGVSGSRAFRENPRRPFAVLQNRLWKKKNADCSPVYIRSSASESRKKDVITLKPV